MYYSYGIMSDISIVQHPDRRHVVSIRASWTDSVSRVHQASWNFVMVNIRLPRMPLLHSHHKLDSFYINMFKYVYLCINI